VALEAANPIFDSNSSLTKRDKFIRDKILSEFNIKSDPSSRLITLNPLKVFDRITDIDLAVSPFKVKINWIEEEEDGKIEYTTLLSQYYLFKHKIRLIEKEQEPIITVPKEAEIGRD
jgi:hypothetical protein